MAQAKWDPVTTVGMPNLSGAAVTASLAQMGRGFDQIGQRVMAQEQLDADTAAQQAKIDMAREELDWTKGAEQRQRDQQALEANLIKEARAGSGGSLADAFFNRGEVQDVLKQEGYTPDMVEALKTKMTSEQKAAFTDPTKYKNDIRDRLVAGGLGWDQATAQSQSAVNEMFPTMDKDIAQDLLWKPGSKGASVFGSGSSGSGGSGSAKMFQGQPSVLDTGKIIDRMVEVNDTPTGSPVTLFGNRILDWGKHDVVKQDLEKFATIAEENGIPASAALKVLQQDIDEDSDLSWDPRNPDIEALRTRAAGIEATERQMYNSKTGDPLANAVARENRVYQQSIKHNAAVLKGLSPKAATFDDRMSLLRDELGLPAEIAEVIAQDGIPGKSKGGTPEVQTNEDKNKDVNELVEALAKPDKKAPAKVSPIAKAIGEGASSIADLGEYVTAPWIERSQSFGQNLIDMLQGKTNHIEETADTAGSVLEDFLAGFQGK